MRTHINHAVCAAAAAGALAMLDLSGTGIAGAVTAAAAPARPASAPTAYVVNNGGPAWPGTVTPISTATNKARYGNYGR
jgi:hypothetical protein